MLWTLSSFGAIIILILSKQDLVIVVCTVIILTELGTLLTSDALGLIFI